MSDDNNTPTPEDNENLQKNNDLTQEQIDLLAKIVALKKEDARTTMEQSARNLEVASAMGDINAQYEAANDFLKAKKEFEQDAVNSTLSHEEAQKKFAAQMGYTADQLDEVEKRAIA